jgi:diaminopimelate epimerase
MDLHFSKLTAAGNDFVMVDNRKKIIDQQHYQSLAKKLCNRRYSIGADGIIFIEDSKPCDFKMKYLNSDGSNAAMCGNGGRAIARFAFEIGAAKKTTMFFETDAGIIHAAVLDEQNVRLNLYDPKDLQRNIKLLINGKNFNIDFIDTGVPHAVTFVEDLDSFDVVEYGRLIRTHKRFAPAGTNVDFVKKKKDMIAVRTYERGVEDETLACGTGIIASAIIAGLYDFVVPPVKVLARGGDELTVSFKRNGDKIHSVVLEGPAFSAFVGSVRI